MVHGKNTDPKIPW